LSKIFTPGTLNAIDLEPLQIVLYQPDLDKGQKGPELWGMAYSDPNDVTHVLLETGEYVTVPATSLTLAIMRDYTPQDVPLSLLACATLFFPLFWSFRHIDIGADRVARIKQSLGNFNARILGVGIHDKKELQPITSVLQSGVRPHENIVNIFALPNTDLEIGIGIDCSMKTPFIRTALLDSNGNELAVGDRPRELSELGVYLFSADATLAALVFCPS
jgi:hypothetical protein